ncbi:MAG: NTP transferase domain-containing protein, partial [Solirubrobacterales bacterium]|nr:NTP transferase domain-containing protein [Solirubrobacterales bacterium]
MTPAAGAARRAPPIGVVLAGGRGRRLGGAKAMVRLRGRPLISYPLAALRAALTDVVVLAKPDSELPDLPGQTVWLERCAEQHPLVGIRCALEQAGDRAALVCAVDLPFVTAELVGRLARFRPSAPVVVARHRGAIQPLLGCYRPEALAQLRAADLGLPMREVVAALEPAFVEVHDPLELFNVNTPAELARA